VKTLSSNPSTAGKRKKVGRGRQGQGQGEPAVLRLPSPDLLSPSRCQQQLPATGVPITHQRFDQMRDMFDDYVRTRTLHNWKFWVVSLLGSVAWGRGGGQWVVSAAARSSYA
jgi:hypothetical protein